MRRTGNYRFQERKIRVGWLRRVKHIQVLMVEIEGPIDAIMTWGRWWEEAMDVDRNAYEHGQRKRQVDLELLQERVKRYQDRLDGIQDLACIA